MYFVRKKVLYASKYIKYPKLRIRTEYITPDTFLCLRVSLRLGLVQLVVTSAPQTEEYTCRQPRAVSSALGAKLIM